jgi:hypothetical protein
MPSAPQLMRIAWPAFLAACALQAIVFAVVDPMELDWFGHPLPWSRQGIYAVAFFLFWGATGAASLMTVLLGGSEVREP